MVEKNTQRCKFCGKEVRMAHYLSQSERSCGECTQHCMRKCELMKTNTLSWHKEPCIKCEHNPYRSKYEWNGKEWIKND